MNVWIVSKIRGSRYAWVHGLTEENQSIRLLRPDGSYPLEQTKFDVGQIWDLTFHKSYQTIPPHVEDVIVTGWKFIGQEGNLRDVLMQRTTPWKGGVDQLFNGYLRHIMYENHAFISERTNFPHISIGYWLLDAPLIKWHESDFLDDTHEYLCYRYYTVEKEFIIDYVGFAKPIFKIPEQTLIHVLLNKWWIPSSAFAPSDDSKVEKRCYLQISDWYL